jgi:hypothetical protein
MKTLLFCLLMAITCSSGFAADDSTPSSAPDASPLTWSPSGLLFQPLRAHIFEPRMGILYQADNDMLRLDIGNSTDLVAWHPEGAEYRMGADFFTYTRLRSEGRFKFPVETTDFYFGINFAAKYATGDNAVSARVRVAHISSHLSDGYNGNRSSFVYSREFVDVTGAYELGSLRLYAGANFLFSSIPDAFGIVTPQLGFDVSHPLAEELTLVGGYDLRFTTVNEATTAVHSAQAGLKLGKQFGSGLLLNGYFYHGKSIHGMFYDLNDSYAGIGIQVDF